ncbi:MAG: copper resistance protein [Azospirillum sp.]|nr:copper resistance protein [Azospirillum sp.]
MALLLDIFGFLSVVLNGLTITAQSLTLGGIAFLLLVADPLAEMLGQTGDTIARRCRRLLAWCAAGFMAASALEVAVQGAVLAGSTGLSPADTLGAEFLQAGLVKTAVALIITVLALARPARGRWLMPVLLALAALAAAALTSHGASRLDYRELLSGMTALHMAGAALWVGGIPYFLTALAECRDGLACHRISARFSVLCMLGVACLLASGITMALHYVDDLQAIYGTAYGVMLVVKILLMFGMLCLGAANFFNHERLAVDPQTPLLRLRRFAEVELGVGIAVFLAAASLTSVPPAVDLSQDRVTVPEIVERMTPVWPRLTSPDHDSLAIPTLQAKLDAEAKARGAAERPMAFVPGSGVLPPSKAEDIAWSEFNHHWSGIFVLAIGLLALLEQTGRVPIARHWPVLFLALAGFLLIRSDPETWPLGDIGFFESLRDPEVAQHRLFVLLITGFALFEWAVRAGPLRGTRAALVFPLITAIGGTLLLTHSHALANVKQELLVELTHIPVALLGIAGGWARWLELRLDPPANRIGGWVWPICFALIGLVLLSYRET